MFFSNLEENNNVSEILTIWGHRRESHKNIKYWYYLQKLTSKTSKAAKDYGKSTDSKAGMKEFQFHLYPLLDFSVCKN